MQMQFAIVSRKQFKANKCGYMRHTDVEGVAGNPQKGI